MLIFSASFSQNKDFKLDHLENHSPTVPCQTNRWCCSRYLRIFSYPQSLHFRWVSGLRINSKKNYFSPKTSRSKCSFRNNFGKDFRSRFNAKSEKCIRSVRKVKFNNVIITWYNVITTKCYVILQLKRGWCESMEVDGRNNWRNHWRRRCSRCPSYRIDKLEMNYVIRLRNTRTWKSPLFITGIIFRACYYRIHINKILLNNILDICMISIWLYTGYCYINYIT